MSTIAAQIKGRIADSGSLLDALDAISNGRAFVTLALTFVAYAIAVATLGGFSAWLMTKSGAMGGLMLLLSTLVWIGIILAGTTAAGILLSDDVWGRERRTIGSALLTAVFTAHRLAVLILLAGAALVVHLIALALVLFLCKIPGLGPLLYAIVFPVSAVVTGLLVFFLFYVMLPLSAPCIWNGDSVTQAIATLKEIVRNRLLYVLVMFLLLSLIVSVAAGIVGFVIFSGAGFAALLSLPIIGSGGDLDIHDLVMSMIGGGRGNGGSSGYIVAFLFGGMVLVLLGAIPVALIGMKGAAIIHKGAISGLALDDAAADLLRQVDDVKRLAQEAREKALASNPAPTAVLRRVCPNPQCGAPTAADDMFCGECGQKLK